MSVLAAEFLNTVRVFFGVPREPLIYRDAANRHETKGN
jgi:hypothetical protein